MRTQYFTAFLVAAGLMMQAPAQAASTAPDRILSGGTVITVDLRQLVLVLDDEHDHRDGRPKAGGSGL